MQTQWAQGDGQTFPCQHSPNTFAELKRLQEELRDEIPYLKDKIDSDLRPKEDTTQQQCSAEFRCHDKANEELERGIALLSGWADEAGARWLPREKNLMKREASIGRGQSNKPLRTNWIKFGMRLFRFIRCLPRS